MKNKNSKQRTNVLQGDIVMGRNTIQEVLKHFPERILQLLIAGRPAPEFLDSIAKLQKRHVPVLELDGISLSQIAQSESHQGMLAVLKPRVKLDLKDWLKEQGEIPQGLVLMLDGVQDPQNLGAILRAAECFGVKAVIWSRNRGPGITAVVAKTSAGASELVPLIEVSNLAEAQRKLKQHKYWLIALENEAGAESLGKFKFPDGCALVLGSEGFGVSQLIKKEADFLVKIDLFGSINSLNVSQATAVVLHEFCRQKAG